MSIGVYFRNFIELMNNICCFFCFSHFKGVLLTTGTAIFARIACQNLYSLLLS